MFASACEKSSTGRSRAATEAACIQNSVHRPLITHAAKRITFSNLAALPRSRYFILYWSFSRCKAFFALIYHQHTTHVLAVPMPIWNYVLNKSFDMPPISPVLYRALCPWRWSRRQGCTRFVNVARRYKLQACQNMCTWSWSNICQRSSRQTSTVNGPNYRNFWTCTVGILHLHACPPQVANFEAFSCRVMLNNG